MYIVKLQTDLVDRDRGLTQSRMHVQHLLMGFGILETILTALRGCRPLWPKQMNPYFAKEVMNVDPLW